MGKRHGARAMGHGAWGRARARGGVVNGLGLARMQRKQEQDGRRMIVCLPTTRESPHRAAQLMCQKSTARVEPGLDMRHGMRRMGSDTSDNTDVHSSSGMRFGCENDLFECGRYACMHACMPRDALGLATRCRAARTGKRVSRSEPPGAVRRPATIRLLYPDRGRGPVMHHGAHAALLAETPVKASRLRENPFARECRSSGLLRHCTRGKLVDFACRFG